MNRLYALCMVGTSGATSYKSFLRNIRENIRQYPKDRRSCSIVAISEGSSPIFCIVRAGIATGRTEEVRDYGKYKLLHEKISPITLLSRLRALAKTQRFTAASVELTFQSIHQPIRPQPHPSGSIYHDRPGNLYDVAVSLGNTFLSSQEPLLGHDVIPYFGLLDAITEWTGIRVSDSDGRFRQLLLFIPSFEAQLVDVFFDNGSLTIKSTASKGMTCDLSVLVSDHVRTERIAVALQPSQTFTVMESPRRLHIFITDAMGGILDRFIEEEMYCTGKPVLFGRPHQQRDLLKLIYGGESDLVEFKPFIRPGDKKWREVMETVIAFANTRGGTILVGVEDNGEIRGIESGERAEAFCGNYVNDLRSLLQQNLNRLPPVQIDMVTVAQKMVMVVSVGVAAMTYFITGDRKLLVRRGANNMAPDWDSFVASQTANLVSSFDNFDVQG